VARGWLGHAHRSSTAAGVFLLGVSRRLRESAPAWSSIAIAIALMVAGALLRSPLAAAEACPGSGAASACPWVSAQIVGQRAEGVLRFPEAVAVDTQGNVYVADQLGYVVQKFSAAGAFETEWGSYGGGHGQFGPIGGIATDAASNVYVVDSSHDRIQKFDSFGHFLGSWGHRGSGLGQFSFGSSQNYTQPPGGGIAVAGSYVYVADSANNRIERFNLSGGEAMSWGSRGSGPGQFIYPRGLAANESEVVVGDDDNHRVEKFDPNGAFQAAAGTRGSGAGEFGFPYGVALDGAGDVYVADDLNHRVVKLSPQLGFLGAWGGFGSKPGQLAFPRALASDPAGDNYVADTANDRIAVYDTNGNLLRIFGLSARGPGQLTAPRGLATDPTGRLLASDTVGNRIEAFAPATFAFAGQWTVAGGHASGFRSPAGIAVDPRGAVMVADRGSERVARLWGDGTFLGEIGGPSVLGGAQLSGAGSVAISTGPDETFVADSGHNRVLVYGPEGSLRQRWGAGEGNGAPGSGVGEFSHPAAVAADEAGTVYVADTGNDRVVELNAGGTVLRMWGSRGTGEGSFRSPNGIALDGAGHVYVLDAENNRVEVFDPSGRFLARFGNRGTGLGQLSQPAAITVDCNGAVYVADTNNNRLERFTLAAPSPSGCLAPGSWPPPLDVAPVLTLRLPRAAGILARRALALSVSCLRGCKVLASATLSALAGRRPRVPLVAAARGLPPAQAGHLRLRVGPRALHRLRRQLGRRTAMRARVRIVAAGPTGRRTTVVRSFIVRR
jgi:tripartite motif-containing protein 71